jgi:hypothetical protein
METTYAGDDLLNCPVGGEVAEADFFEVPSENSSKPV